MTIKTEKENLIEVRNKISLRRTECIANTVYWKTIIKESKKNTQQIVDANSKLSINQKNLKADKVFLECIDRLIEGENNG